MATAGGAGVWPWVFLLHLFASSASADDCSYTYIACGDDVGAGPDAPPRLDASASTNYFLPLLT